MEIAKWMALFVGRNQALSEVDDLLMRSLAAAKPIASKTSVRYMCYVAKKMGDRIAVNRGEALGIRFYDWTSRTPHFIAIYGLFDKHGALQQMLLVVLPAEYGQSTDDQIKLFDAILDVYKKDGTMLLFIVADNCTTNKAKATRLGLFFSAALAIVSI